MLNENFDFIWLPVGEHFTFLAALCYDVHMSPIWHDIHPITWKKQNAMKHIICLLLFYCCLRAAAAQDTLRILSEHGWDPTLTEIDIRELPEAIKQKVSSGQYSSWIVQAAYTTPALGGIATTRNSDGVDYIVELKKEDEVIRVRFDDAGNKREENNPD